MSLVIVGFFAIPICLFLADVLAILSLFLHKYRSWSISVRILSAAFLVVAWGFLIALGRIMTPGSGEPPDAGVYGDATLVSTLIVVAAAVYPHFRKGWARWGAGRR